MPLNAPELRVAADLLRLVAREGELIVTPLVGFFTAQALSQRSGQGISS